MKEEMKRQVAAEAAKIIYANEGNSISLISFSVSLT